MTVVHVETNYLEGPYLEGPHLAVDVLGYMGQQAQFVINKEPPVGMQCQIVINSQQAQGQQAEFVIDAQRALGQQVEFVIDAQKALGQQARPSIVDFLGAQGQQAHFTIGSRPPLGQQADFTIGAEKALGQQAQFALADAKANLGQQAEFNVVSYVSPYGMQYTQDNIAHVDCDGYLEGPYLEGLYLSRNICAHGGHQAFFRVTRTEDLGQQAEFTVVDHLTALGQQAEIHVNDHVVALGQQAQFILSKSDAYGQQAEINIVDHLLTLGQQVEITVNYVKAYGQQVEIIQLVAVGMQTTVALYNTTNLRILCDFPSRGLETATGSNAWGNDAGIGKNWKSNSTEAGDFSPFNLNTDIVEQVWRSDASTVSGINLDCDTERPQGVFLDTLGILNHNLTSSATVTLLGSNTSNFSVIGVSIPLEVRSDDPNIYYIAPTLPNAGYRYWRISIDDASNPAGFVEIGTVVFGASSIFVGECFVDQVDFQLKDYTDSVQTEGFTNVNNSRAQKKVLRLDFKSLSYLRSNFRIMRNMFRRERTVLKCLWIPTPSPTIQEYSARFALFSKLSVIPTEQHNHKGGTADYVSFTIELDESL